MYLYHSIYVVGLFGEINEENENVTINNLLDWQPEYSGTCLIRNYLDPTNLCTQMSVLLYTLTFLIRTSVGLGRLHCIKYSMCRVIVISEHRIGNYMR